ncbi:hypothetical protein J5N97_026195 [Dioscorea zingiberensis]|uniref:Uncharacterized protein n=1 Tax=Dioscorea zingiberensis TaxID=325984 RepID=A0A9D5H6L4_9LILI|nr:hypothetical protein J5N97_026195 [Dioscorea zingiberensis]
MTSPPLCCSVLKTSLEIIEALADEFNGKEARRAADFFWDGSTFFIFNSSKLHGSMKSTTPRSSDPQASSETTKDVKPVVKKKNNTSNSEHEGPKTPDPKTLRRLAQNREAARKSRLRKKAYVQQLECSRIKLAQLEQELQRARAQGLVFGGEGIIGDQGGNIGALSSGGASLRMCELRAAVEEHLPESELQVYVGNCLSHYDEMMNLKNIAIKTDVFHLVSGVWMAPAERCFMWLGGFRPSKIIKQYLSNTILSEALSFPSNMADYMDQMAIAMNKLSSFETFVRQADGLRQQTLHRLHQILTSRQAARGFLAIAEYFHRLRALSSLWLARPRQAD